MKAKDLAELLLRNPDFEVRCVFTDTSKNAEDHLWPDVNFLNVIGIADIGYSSKVILLEAEQPNDSEA